MAESSVEVTIAAVFREFAVPLGSGETWGIGFWRFSCFLHHFKFISFELDHHDALQLFIKAADTIPRDEDDPVETQYLEQRHFKMVLSLLGGVLQEVAALPTNQHLGKVINMVNLRRDGFFEEKHLGRFKVVFSHWDQTNAAYSYSDALGKVFCHYSSLRVNSRRNGRAQMLIRSFYRFCRATQLVPSIVFPMELNEVAKMFFATPDQGRSVLASSYRQGPDVNAFIDDGKLTGDADQDVFGPVTSALPGEPALDFPQFMSLLIATVLYAPPPVDQEPIEDQVSRIHHILGDVLRIPTNEDLGAISWSVDELFREEDNTQEITNSVEVMVNALKAELPPLPPVPHKKLTNPGPNEIFYPQPKSREEIAAEKAAQTKKKTKKKKVEGVKFEPRWGQVDPVTKMTRGAPPTTYVAMKQPPPPPEKHIQDRRDDLTQVWKNFKKELDDRAALDDDPGFVVEIADTLYPLDEPLVAPPCDVEDVVSLMETANAFRKTHDYDYALQSLQHARAEWVYEATEGQVVFAGFRPREGPWAKYQGSGADAQDESADLSATMQLPQGQSERGRIGERETIYAGAPPVGQLYFDWDNHPHGVLEQGALEGMFLEAGAGGALPPEVGLYFSVETASILAAMGRDEDAFRVLVRAREYADQLDEAHPERATVFCAMGRTIYHLGFPELAARCYMRAQHHREITIGPNTVEAATAYHNVAVCFVAIGRNKEGLAYLTLAHKLLTIILGDAHPRSQASLQHLNKVKMCQLKLTNDLPHAWFKSYVLIGHFPEKTKKKPKKTGKK
mmetsp:Transcript_19653/g.47625  ORF Transcript_19653/g.47625 Transcript_19653/m.47625 type:complete len:789 (+) Transcript_19653:60-2426(+)